MLHEILAWLFGIATSLVETLGYWGVFFGMVIESACIPLPSEAIEGFAGYLVSQGKMNLWLVALVGALGNAVGSTIMYVLGKRGGKPLVMKYGKYVLVGEEEFEKAEKWFERHGDKAIFFAQLLPVIRTYISLPGGVLAKKYPKFIAYTFTGAFIWCLLLAYLGKIMGENWEGISQYLKPVEWVVVALGVLVVGWYVWKKAIKLRNKKHKK